jgi:spermidine/putrescine transport system substrate-binding protein
MGDARNTSGAAATMAAARDFNRRGVLKGAAAAGALGVAAPWIVRNARASSGEVDVYTWQGYISEEMTQAFEDETGIKVNLSVYGTNNEVLNKLRASKGEGFDIVCPSVTYLPSWHDAGELLQPIDESKIEVDNIKSALWQQSVKLGATYRGKRYAIPFNWGTEAIAFNAEERDYKPGEVSYADLWSEENKGLITVRPRSVLTSLILLRDGPEVLDKAHQDEETAKDAFGRAMEFAIEHKEWVRQFWKDAPAIENAFLNNGCVIGQTWDGPTINLWKNTDGRIKYLAPKEGALTWLDTMCITSGAKNVEQAYAFINFMTTAEMGGAHARHAGYNSAMKGAEQYLKPDARERFQYIYNDGKAIEELYWWKPSQQWFQQLRAQYIEKYEAA